VNDAIYRAEIGHSEWPPLLMTTFAPIALVQRRLMFTGVKLAVGLLDGKRGTRLTQPRRLSTPTRLVLNTERNQFSYGYFVVTPTNDDELSSDF
jgi:hypothetical protein